MIENSMIEQLTDILPIIFVAVIILGATAWIGSSDESLLRKFKLYRITRLFSDGANIKSRVEQVQQELMPKPSDKE